jgi:hypothetical protein
MKKSRTIGKRYLSTVQQQRKGSQARSQWNFLCMSCCMYVIFKSEKTVRLILVLVRVSLATPSLYYWQYKFSQSAHTHLQKCQLHFREVSKATTDHRFLYCCRSDDPRNEFVFQAPSVMKHSTLDIRYDNRKKKNKKQK